MEPQANTKSRTLLGRLISVAAAIAALSLGLAVLYRTNHNPRTDDAEVLANFIGIAPQVEGPLVHLCVRDNQFVKQGELLYEIDPRPYEYAFERAVSEQATLEGQIADERRRISAQVSAVSVAQATIHSSQAEINRYQAAVDQAKADVANAEQGVERARAEWTYANNNLNRIQPLLVKQFVTVDQVDKAKSSEIALAQGLKQAESQQRVSEAEL
jgi:membrane fusion protein, multidrug efflux system